MSPKTSKTWSRSNLSKSDSNGQPRDFTELARLNPNQDTSNQTVDSKSSKPSTLQPSITNESDPNQQLRDSSDLAKINQNHKPIHQPTKCNTATNRETWIKQSLKAATKQKTNLTSTTNRDIQQSLKAQLESQTQPPTNHLTPTTKRVTPNKTKLESRNPAHNQIWHRQPTARCFRA